MDVAKVPIRLFPGARVTWIAAAALPCALQGIITLVNMQIVLMGDFLSVVFSFWSTVVGFVATTLSQTWGRLIFTGELVGPGGSHCPGSSRIQQLRIRSFGKILAKWKQSTRSTRQNVRRGKMPRSRSWSNNSVVNTWRSRCRVTGWLVNLAPCRSVLPG